METISNEVQESQNEEANEKVVENIIEEATEPQPTQEIQQEEAKREEAEEKPKPKATAKKLPGSVKVVEMVNCPDCDKRMLPKSLKHSHPRNCKGQPSETLPVNKQKNSYGSKLKEQMRKEIEEEMKNKYQNKENDKNAQNVTNEFVQYSEPIEVANAREAQPSVKTKRIPKKPVIMKQPERQLTATELLQQSYNEMKRLKQQEKAEKIARFKTSMF